MRVDKAGKQIPGPPAFFLCAQVGDGAVCDPGAGVQPFGQLGDLRNVIHFAPAAVGLQHIIVVFFPQHLVIRRIRRAFPCHFLLFLAGKKAPQRVRIGMEVAFANAVRAVARAHERVHKGGPAILGHGRVFIATGVQGILPVNHGTARRDAHRASRIRAGKGHALPRQAIQMGRFDDGIAQRADGIEALLVHKNVQNVGPHIHPPRAFFSLYHRPRLCATAGRRRVRLQIKKCRNGFCFLHSKSAATTPAARKAIPQPPRAMSRNSRQIRGQSDRISALSVLQCRAHQAGEQGMRAVGTGLELRMELHAHEPGVIH